ncbi:MAG: isocitrate/isopropylmalate family dehydrogenase, partial [Thermodesulfobacteriota bacterium]
MKKTTKTGIAECVDFFNNETLRNICGEQDRNIRLIEKLAAVNLVIRGNAVSINGDRISVTYAVDTRRYSEGEVRRILRVGFEQAQRRRRRLTSVDKANILQSGR